MEEVFELGNNASGYASVGTGGRGRCLSSVVSSTTEASREDFVRDVVDLLFSVELDGLTYRLIASILGILLDVDSRAQLK